MSWNLAQRIAFRFFACYIFLYTMSNQFIASSLFEMLWQKVVPWFAENVLQLSDKITVFTNGSGDTTYNYVCLLLFVIISALVTLIWTLINPQKPKEENLMDWLLVLIRYYVVFNMVLYGLAKIFYLQFQEPYFSKLIQPYGDSSPMGLLWTFMGYSMGYTMFTGFAEFIGGVLLLFRQTRTLGALVVFGVMANVMALNFFYDVPVKLLSTHLVLLSLFLLMLDGKRFLDFFVWNKSVAPREIRPFFANPKWERIKNISKAVLLVGGLTFGVYYVLDIRSDFMESMRPKLQGLYEVETFVRNGEEIPPLKTDSTRWDKIVVQWKGNANIRYMNEKMKFFKFEPDSLDSFVLIGAIQDTTGFDTLFYSQPDSSHLHFHGIYNSDTLNIECKVKKKEDFLLMNRGFRWINEYPFNR